MILGLIYPTIGIFEDSLNKANKLNNSFKKDDHQFRLVLEDASYNMSIRHDIWELLSDEVKAHLIELGYTPMKTTANNDSMQKD